jgi:xanthine dehydrogenase iron-sulfur cluster and FAD-binding subunit A
MSARTVLNRNPDPGEEEIREALSGHLCRCISHYHVIGAVKEVTIARLEGAKRSKELLLDEPFTDTVVQRAAEEVLSGARPLTGNGFKIEIAKVLLRRAIRRCACGC